MLVQLYIIIIILAFLFFSIALILGSLDFILANSSFIVKKGLPATLMFTSMVLFIFVAMSSLNIQSEYCESYINGSMVNAPLTSPHNITNTANFFCHTERSSDLALGGFFAFMALFSAIFAFYYGFGIKEGF